MKVKVHFNRINMQRGKQTVWSAHTSKACNPSKQVVFMYRGMEIARTVFKPGKKDNPRAWVEADGLVTTKNGTTYVEVV